MGKDYYLRYLETEKYKDSRRQKAELISEIARSYIQESKVIVDLGSGTGLVKSYLSQKFRKPILGIEIDRGVILVKEDVCVGDVTRLPLQDKSVDFLICNHLYEHVQEKARTAFFQELRRVLVDDGAIYMTAGNKFQIIEPHYRLPFLSWLPLVLANLYLRVTGRGSDYSGVHFLAYFHLMRDLEQADLSVQDVTYDVLVQHGNRMKMSYKRILSTFVAGFPPDLAFSLLRLCSDQWFLVLGGPARLVGKERLYSIY